MVENPLPGAEPQKPKSGAENWILQYGFIAILFAFLLWQIFKNPQGLPILSMEQFLIVVGIVAVFYLVAQGARFWDRQEQAKLKFKPFDPFKDLPLLKRRLLRERGIRIEFTKWIPEPEFGRASHEDNWATHIGFVITYPDGFREAGQASLGTLFGNLAKFEPGHTHIEVANNSWSGARKQFDVGSTRFVGAPVQIRPAPLDEPPSEQEAEDNEDGRE